MVRTKKQTRYRGLAVVEVALVLPLLLLLTFGAIKYGWLFLKAQQITNAARLGARLAILPNATTDDVLNAIKSLMESAGMDESGYAVTITPGIDLELGEVLNVKITVPIANIDIMDMPLFPQGGSLGASVTMAKEGP